ncbi:MAG: RNA polymerase sigma factor RpoD, partial [Rhodospirillales bacterium]|nr:RNA polymerase sigma factor RpoD [Rhodospirillales bacterium]
MAKAAATTTAEPKEPQESGDSPLLDTLGAGVKKMIAAGKQRGFVTYDDLNAALPPDQVSSEQIEDTMTMLSEMGINVVETEEAEEAATDKEPAETEVTPSGGNVDEADLGRTDDPVRMYLREMGSVELLSREGEIAIAKRIEAGREMMIGGICESPLTIRAIVQWHDALVSEEMLLRDIIDLEATHGGGPGAAIADNVVAVAVAAPVQPGAKDVVEEARKGVAKDDKKANKKDGGDGAGNEAGEHKEGGDGEDDDDSEEQNLSLAALEAKLTPGVLETFEKITKTYKKLHKLQGVRLEAMRKGDEIKPSQEKRYGKLRNELIALMEDVHLNNARIEQLVEQLYELNRSLISHEGKLLRMATTSKIKREDFLEHYRGAELEPGWLRRIGRLPTKNWKRFVTRYGIDVKAVREAITEISREAGLPIGEYRRIV